MITLFTKTHQFGFAAVLKPMKVTLSDFECECLQGSQRRSQKEKVSSDAVVWKWFQPRDEDTTYEGATGGTCTTAAGDHNGAADHTDSPTLDNRRLETCYQNLVSTA